MNNKFFNLSKEKQDRILNAGYKSFAQHAYKKASMLSIAEEAQISKSLLFHYFRDKKTLYMFLFQSAVKFLKEIKQELLQTETDFFEALYHELEVRINLLNCYPYIYQFIINVYFEEDKNVLEDITSVKKELLDLQKKKTLVTVDRSKFKNPEDFEVLYDMIINMLEGYLTKKIRTNDFNVPQIRTETILMMENLKRNYYKENEVRLR